MTALTLAALAAHAEPENLSAEPAPARRQPAPRISTAGYRILLPYGNRAELRAAVVQTFDGLTIVEGTLRGQVSWRALSAGIELVGGGGTSSRWSDVAVGNLVLDLRVVFASRSTHAFGLRGTAPVGARSDARGNVAWWGTVPAAMAPTVGAAVAYEGAFERWVWHAHAGLHADDWWAYAHLPGVFDLGAGVATVQPIAGPVSGVAELEVLNAQSPLHLRALGRVEGGGWTADLGLAVPLPAMATDPSVQVIGALRRAW